MSRVSTPPVQPSPHTLTNVYHSTHPAHLQMIPSEGDSMSMRRMGRGPLSNACQMHVKVCLRFPRPPVKSSVCQNRALPTAPSVNHPHRLFRPRRSLTQRARSRSSTGSSAWLRAAPITISRRRPPPRWRPRRGAGDAIRRSGPLSNAGQKLPGPLSNPSNPAGVAGPLSKPSKAVKTRAALGPLLSPTLLRVGVVRETERVAATSSEPTRQRS